MSQEITRWADSAMYRSEPMPEKAAGPVVTLLNATPDPLGSLAALCGIYEGRVIRSLGEVTDDQRHDALEAMTKTALSGPLEAIQFHFLIENVTRSWTHQAVRTRQQFVAQESMRFAVVEDEAWSERAAMPPSIASGSERVQSEWRQAMDYSQKFYSSLIMSGVPAEDARGVMPHDMTTRMHVVMSLRTLLHQAGLRLCTQAQFEWRAVMAGMVNALRDHAETVAAGRWQFLEIANLLRPVCYQDGKCGFMAKFDRSCSIRSRVDAFERNAVPSSKWHEEGWTEEFSTPDSNGRKLLPISPAEWALDPTAARKGAK